jgi:hypothetical protein
MTFDQIVSEVREYFKLTCTPKLDSPQDLFESERNLHIEIMRLANAVEQSWFKDNGTGYIGQNIEREGKHYTYLQDRNKTVHGLFGQFTYARAYYIADEKGNDNCVPLDDKLGIDKKHTPACQYFLDLHTGDDVYEKGLRKFHAAFRPSGSDYISQRKALDMDYHLGKVLEEKKQEEIALVFDQHQPEAIQKERVIEDVAAISIDGTCILEWTGSRNPEDKKPLKTEGKETKIATISRVRWDQDKKEAHCYDTTYVGGIEEADKVFPRIYVEMLRRLCDTKKVLKVFICDGGKWIWPRIIDMIEDGDMNYVFILDYYHASAKALFGEGTLQYKEHFDRWRGMMLDGKILNILSEFRMRKARTKRKAAKEVLRKDIAYFELYKDYMKYNEYREKHLPIGSGTVESACKNVVGNRMKRGGMIWSKRGGHGMLQICASINSSRFYDDFLYYLRRQEQAAYREVYKAA